jgi:hypothetical protein
MNGIAWCVMGFLATLALGGGSAGVSLHGISLHGTGGTAHHSVRIGTRPYAQVRTQAPVQAHDPYSLTILCPATGC